MTVSTQLDTPFGTHICAMRVAVECRQQPLRNQFPFPISISSKFNCRLFFYTSLGGLDAHANIQFSKRFTPSDIGACIAGGEFKQVWAQFGIEFDGVKSIILAPSSGLNKGTPRPGSLAVFGDPLPSSQLSINA